MSAGKIITVNSRKFDGTLRRTWKCSLVSEEGPALLFEGEFSEELTHPELGFIRRGTVSYEYYWTDRWYNIFRFHEPDGELRNFYCNVNMPPSFDGSVLDYVDLDIDIVVWPDGRLRVLDEEEFRENAARYSYPTDIIEKAEETLSDLVALARNGDLFAIYGCLD